MPMGIVSDDEFNKELGNSRTDKSIDQAIVKELNRPGRHSGDNNVPDSLRKIIGETSEIDGRQEGIALGKGFGISPSSVSAYSNGSNSTASYNKQPNLAHINQAKERISRKARIKLVNALDQITPEKLSEAKLETVANVARSMSAIVKDMEPDIPMNEREGKTGPTFVFYSPQVKKEEQFEHIFVKDNT